MGMEESVEESRREDGFGRENGVENDEDEESDEDSGSLKAEKNGVQVNASVDTDDILK